MLYSGVVRCGTLLRKTSINSEAFARAQSDVSYRLDGAESERSILKTKKWELCFLSSWMLMPLLAEEQPNTRMAPNSKRWEELAALHRWVFDSCRRLDKNDDESVGKWEGDDLPSTSLKEPEEDCAALVSHSLISPFLFHYVLSLSLSVYTVYCHVKKRKSRTLNTVNCISTYSLTYLLTQLLYRHMQEVAAGSST